VQPLDYVDVGAQVSGQLKKLHVEVGSLVQAGDLLAEIDPTVLTATVDARRAGLRNQRATLAERESQLVLAQLLLTRQQNLMKDDATTTESLQQAEANARAAKAQVDATRASIEQTESTLRADEANLNYARIYAPMTGTVVSVTARQGQTLNANQQAPTILRIADLSTMTVQTQVSEADVSKLRQGMEVYFTTLGSQGRRWYGTLRKVEPTPTVTNNVVLYNALFDVPNANQALMTNMTAQVFFIAATAKDTLLIPAAALSSSGMRPGDAAGRRDRAASGPGRAGRAASASTPDGAASTAPAASIAMHDRRHAGGAASAASATTSGFATDTPRGPRRATVKLLTAAGTLEDRPVELGVSNRVQTQVLSGLAEGDQVVAGVKLPPAVQRSGSQSQSGSGLQQNPAGMPPGLGGPRGR
jgi:macrolide-specific efflux system membrane fusion protein